LTENVGGAPEPADVVPPLRPSPPPPPPPRISGRARNALIGGATAAVVAAVVLTIVFAGHHGRDTAQAQGQTITVPPMTFNLQASAKAVLDGSDVVGCTLAEDALLTATNALEKDTDNPSAAVADAQKAISQADEAAEAAKGQALQSAITAMKAHLTALHDSAQVNDVGQEATVLLSMHDDMNAVYSACPY
jgi:hypothetical protein